MEAKAQRVSNNLGLVCITNSESVRYKRTTRKRLLSFPENEQAELLRTVYAANAGVLENAVDFCLANNIRLYRISSDLFQFSDEPFGSEILTEFARRLKAVGARALQSGIRLVSHPDQFVVLSSDSEDVIANSVKILNMHANTMDLLGQPRSEWTTMMIHGGKGNRSDRLVDSILKLPEAVRSRIAFENDEYAYSSAQILDVCKRAGVRMVFDAHHHVCREKLDSFDDPSVDAAFWAARETWNDPANQLVHISNGREHFNDRAHSDLIATMPAVYRFAPWIEVEAKHKELAIGKLTDEWI
jgi:UV DNA damage endonuclease